MDSRLVRAVPSPTSGRDPKALSPGSTGPVGRVSAGRRPVPRSCWLGVGVAVRASQDPDGQMRASPWGWGPLGRLPGLGAAQGRNPGKLSARGTLHQSLDSAQKSTGCLKVCISDTTCLSICVSQMPHGRDTRKWSAAPSLSRASCVLPGRLSRGPARVSGRGEGMAAASCQLTGWAEWVSLGGTRPGSSPGSGRAWTGGLLGGTWRARPGCRWWGQGLRPAAGVCALQEGGGFPSRAALGCGHRRHLFLPLREGRADPSGSRTDRRPAARSHGRLLPGSGRLGLAPVSSPSALVVAAFRR